MQLTVDTGSLQVTIALIAIVVGATILVVAHWRRRFDISPLRLALACAVAALLLLALTNPKVDLDDDERRWEIVAVVDVSESTRRGQNDSAHVDWLSTVAGAAPAGGSSSVVVFGRDAAVVVDSGSIDSLPRGAMTSSDAAGVAGDGTSIAAGLRAARSVLRTDRATSIVLVSDGMVTDEGALQLAEQLGREGVPVHVLPLAPAPATMGLVAADLPGRVQSGLATKLRTVLNNASPRPADFRFEVARDGEQGAVHVASLSAGGLGSLHQELVFDEAGLHAVSGILRAPSMQQRRDFYTLVVAPIRVAVIGAGAAGVRWRKFLDADRYTVESVAPGTSLDTGAFDVAILDAVESTVIGDAQLADLAAAVAAKDLGLLVVNGPHPRPDTQPTVAMSYEGTVLDPYLPTTSKPRPKRIEPPGLEIIISIDVSGSMSGWKCQKAREIAAHIINQLGPKDTLRLYAFHTATSELMDGKVVDRGAAVRKLPNNCDGGTAPYVPPARKSRSGRCGLFFISDLQFRDQLRSHACASTVFAIGTAKAGGAASLGELHPVAPGFDPGSVTLGFFKPKPRKKYFERDSFLPDVIAGDAALARLSLDGNAIGLLRDQAEPILVRPHTDDAVLAFAGVDDTRVASFLTALPDAWAENEAGRRALDSWLRRLVRWSERDRYRLTVERSGDALSISVGLNAPADEVSALTLRVLPAAGPGGSARAERLSPRHFHARIDGLRRWSTGWGTLVVDEDGSGSVRRQEIPMYIPEFPAASSTSVETWTSGLDEALLQSLAEAGGGFYRPRPDDLRPWADAMPEDPVSLWQPLAVAAMPLLLVLVFLDRSYPGG